MVCRSFRRRKSGWRRCLAATIRKPDEVDRRGAAALGAGERREDRDQWRHGRMQTGIHGNPDCRGRSDHRSQAESLCPAGDHRRTGGDDHHQRPGPPQLNVNGGSNALGEGWRANATIGRFVQLIKRNIGGSYPGTTCKATLGWPGKYSICVGENEEASPWEPLHVERGFKAEQSTVTAISADASIRASDLDSSKAGRRADQFRAENGRTVRAGSDHGHLSGACQDHRR